MQRTRKRVDVNLEELDQIIDRSMRAPIAHATLHAGDRCPEEYAKQRKQERAAHLRRAK